MDQITYNAPPVASPAPPPPPYHYAPQPTYIQRARTNGMAIASLVCSLVCLFGLGSLLGIIFGLVAKRQIEDARTIGSQESGSGMATAGIVIGVLGIVGIIAFFALIGAAASHAGQQLHGYSDCLNHVSPGSSTFANDMDACSKLLTK